MPRASDARCQRPRRRRPCRHGDRHSAQFGPASISMRAAATISPKAGTASTRMRRPIRKSRFATIAAPTACCRRSSERKLWKTLEGGSDPAPFRCERGMAALPPTPSPCHCRRRCDLKDSRCPKPSAPASPSPLCCSPAPVLAGPAEDAFLAKLQGVWSGSGTLTGSETGKVDCTMTIRARSEGLNFRGKCDAGEFGPAELFRHCRLQ